MYFLFHIWCCKHTTVQKIFNDISISLPFLPHKDHPNKLNNQFNLRRTKKLLSSQWNKWIYICFFQMSAIVQSCLQYDIVGYRFNRIDIKLQQWWIIMNYGILKYFPRDYFFYKKSNMPYSVIEGTEHKHTSVHHTCSRFKDNKKYNLTCSNMM